MTYAWQKNAALRSGFLEGQAVTLNEAWSAHAYLQKEFGPLFPRKVHACTKDGIVTVKVGKAEVTFAAQVLRPA